MFARSISSSAMSERSPSARKQQIQGNTLQAYAMAVAGLILCWKFASDGVFSSLLTLGAGLQLVSFVFIAVQIKTLNTAEGVSKSGLVVHLVSVALRLAVNMQFQAYLPVDASGDWLYQLIDIMSLLGIAYLIKMVAALQQRTGDDCFDVRVRWVVAMFAVAAFIAILVHPSLISGRRSRRDSMYALGMDVAWTTSLYLDAVAAIPLLALLTRRGGDVDPRTCHFLVAQFLGCCAKFAFWAHAYTDLNKRGSYGGYGVLVAHVLQMMLTADFVFHYVCAVRKHQRMNLPSLSVSL